MDSSDGRAVSIFVLLLFPLCMSGMATVQQGGNLIVADFENKTVETNHGLTVVIIADEQFGGASEGRVTLVQPGADGSRGAARIAFQISDGFVAPFAGAWAALGDDGMATDMTAYRGLRFHARAKAGAYAASILQASGQATLYQASFEVQPEWTVVELPFEKFRPTGPTGAPVADAPALVPKALSSVGFNVSSRLRGTFDLEIDQVQLYR